jgi:hypothetical protein
LVVDYQQKIANPEGMMTLRVPDFCLVEQDYMSVSALPQSLQ